MFFILLSCVSHDWICVCLTSTSLITVLFALSICLTIDIYIYVPDDWYIGVMAISLDSWSDVMGSASGGNTVCLVMIHAVVTKRLVVKKTARDTEKRQLGSDMETDLEYCNWHPIFVCVFFIFAFRVFLLLKAAMQLDGRKSLLCSLPHRVYYSLFSHFTWYVIVDNKMKFFFSLSLTLFAHVCYIFTICINVCVFLLLVLRSVTIGGHKCRHRSRCGVSSRGGTQHLQTRYMQGPTDPDGAQMFCLRNIFQRQTVACFVSFLLFGNAT